MRRKKLLRQIAAAAVALSMAASLSAPAFAATFDLSKGGLVITADESGITVTQDGQQGSTSIGDDEEIEVTGSYVRTTTPADGAQDAEENLSDLQQQEKSTTTPAGEARDAEEDLSDPQQQEKNTITPADGAQDAEEDLSDPQQQEKNTTTPAGGDLNASADEGQDEENQETNTEARASAEASTGASDNASNGPRKAPARSGGEESKRGIIQIVTNTAKKLVKLTLDNATIDQPTAAYNTDTRGMAAIDIQGSGNVEITVKGNNTLIGYGNSAGIQKNDDVSDGTLTITAEDKNQTLNVIADVRGAAIGGNGSGSYGENTDGRGHGTKNIEIKGGTVKTRGRIGSGYDGGSAENIVITGDAVVNANGGIGGGAGEGYESNEGRKTSITISGNAKVTATDKANVRAEYYQYYDCADADLAVIGGGYCGTAEITISGNAVVNAKAEDRKNRSRPFRGAGAVIGGGLGGYSENKKSSAKVTIEGNAQVTAENNGYGGGAGIGGGANGTGEVIIGGNAQVKATGSAEHHGGYFNCGAGAAIGNGGTTGQANDTVQNGENKFTPDDGIQDGAKVEMTNIGQNGSDTVTQTYKNGDWVTHHHDYQTVTVPSTCTQSGYTVSKCSSCGEEKGERTNIVAPLGHEYKNGVCTRCGAPEPQENGSAAPNYTVTGAEAYETSVVDGRYIIAVPSEDAALHAVLGDLRAIKAQGADAVVFCTRNRESSLVINEMLAMGADATPFVLTHNGSEAQLTINGAAHNELIH